MVPSGPSDSDDQRLGPFDVVPQHERARDVDHGRRFCIRDDRLPIAITGSTGITGCRGYSGCCGRRTITTMAATTRIAATAMAAQTQPDSPDDEATGATAAVDVLVEPDGGLPTPHCRGRLADAARQRVDGRRARLPAAPGNCRAAAALGQLRT